MLKWELLIPVIILGGLGSGLTELDESAGLAALYTLAIEVWVYKDLSSRRTCRASPRRRWGSRARSS